MNMRLCRWAGTLVAFAFVVPTWANEAAGSAREENGPAGSIQEAFGPQYDSSTWYHRARERHRPGQGALHRLRYWNQVAVDATGVDHTPVGERERRVFGEQFGPSRSARALAIVHIAMFDSVNAVVGGYEGYTGLQRAARDTSVDAAIAQSAHDTLVAMFPSQERGFDRLLAEDLRRIPQRDGRSKSRGISLGKRAAAAILAGRANDGSAHKEPRLGIDFIVSDDVGKWRQDPIAQQAVAMGAQWSEVRPFVLRSGDQFRVPPPPALRSREYAAAYNEVLRLGGDGVSTPTVRTRDQTEAGVFWAYDGTPTLCAPPRLYNQIVVQIAQQKRSSLVETARLLALTNVALADAGLAVWESKYHYQVWRPVTGIREANVGTGPTGVGDGNPATRGNSSFKPLGAPASNLNGPNFTPPFPAYPSGHAGFGGAVFEMLRNFYGTDRIAFTFISDELDGETADNQGTPRPLRPRSFRTLSQAEQENGQSRIYLGIHWSFDASAGITQGRRVADYVFARTFRPVRGRGHLELDNQGE